MTDQDQIHDLDLTTEAAATLADFLTAARQHREGLLTKQDVRDMWVSGQWGSHVPKALAGEVMR